MILKVSIAYCINNGRTVYCAMLDATKGLYQVEYCKLFELLTERCLPSVIIRLLLNVYTGHLARISWNGVNSNCFLVKNGVDKVP